MLRSTSTTQGVIALISGESEFYASVKGTSAGLGAVSMLKDLGVDNCKKTKIDKAVLEVRVDASAGRGIAVRQRAGRICHIATPTLWVHKLTQDGTVKITKIPGVSNPEDIGTKHLDGGSIRRALERCHCYTGEGRAGIALRAEVQEITKSHPEVFAVDNACEVDTQSEMDMESDQYRSREQRYGETEKAERPSGVNQK